MTKIGHGDVVKYAYLWAREHGYGEVTGRKTRPACVMIIVAEPNGNRRTLLFPITSQ